MLPECGRCSAAPRSVTYLLTQLTWPRLDILQLGTPVHSWNNEKEVPRLDLTSSTMPGQQIHKFDHTRTANPCNWLPCPRAALLLVGCPHSLVYLHLPVVEGLIFCISATPHLGTSFPLFHETHSPNIVKITAIYR